MKLKNPLSRQKVYRVTIYSKDAISGNARDGVYQIDIPDFIQDINTYHVAVEEALLYTGSADSGTGGNSRTYVFESSLVAPDSHSTSTKSNTRVLFQMIRSSSSNAPGSYTKPITSNTFGIPLVDVNFLRNKQLRINIKRSNDTDHDDVTLPLASTGWSLTLIIYPFEQA
jgi:hypothetical protein